MTILGESKFDKLYKSIISQAKYKLKGIRALPTFGNHTKTFLEVFPYLTNYPSYFDEFLMKYTQPSGSDKVCSFKLTDEAYTILTGKVPAEKDIFVITKYRVRGNQFNSISLKDDQPVNIADKMVLASTTETGNTIKKLLLVFNGDLTKPEEPKDINNYQLVLNKQFSDFGMKWTDELIKEYIPEFETYNNVFQKFLKEYTCPYHNGKGNIVKNTFMFTIDGAAKFRSKTSTKWVIKYAMSLHDAKYHRVDKESFILAIAFQNEIPYENEKFNSYICTRSNQPPTSLDDIRVEESFFKY